MHFSHLTLLPVHSNEKIYRSLKKMVEENIDNLMPSGYDAHSQKQKNKSFSNASSPEIASCIWVKFRLKNKLTNLAMKKWINFLVIMKLNSQVRW